MKKLILFLTCFIVSISIFSNENIFTLNYQTSNNYSLSNTSYSMGMSMGSYKPISGKYAQARKNLKGCILGTACILAVDGILIGFNSVQRNIDVRQDGTDWYAPNYKSMNAAPFITSSLIGVGAIWTWYIVLGSKK
jgi:hypothetical protein